MAGRCRKKLNLSRASSVKSCTKPPPGIPYDIVELIISRLSFRDSIRASLVCKQWFIIAFSLRKKPMWLMMMPLGREKLYEFVDPWKLGSHRVKLPELVQESRMCYSGHGWLLLYKRCDRLVIFFSPYTRESIKLPTLELSGEDDIVAFCGPPTSPDCLVFTVSSSSSSSSSLAISTCCVRSAVWKTVNYPQGGFLLSNSKVVVCKGLFCCLGGCGGIGIYDPETLYWRVFEAVVLPGRYPLCNRWCSGNFVAEYKGDVYFLFTRHRGCKTRPALYKLRLPSDWRSTRSGFELVRVMERNGGFQGMTLLAGSMAGSFAMDVATMRNAICYPHYWVSGTMHGYSLDDKRYYPNSHSPCDWEELDAWGYIWIEPPEDASVLWSDRKRKIFSDLLRSGWTAADLLAYF